MKLFVNKDNKHLILGVAAVMAGLILLSQGMVWYRFRKFSPEILLLSVLAACGALTVCLWYLKKEDRLLEAAVCQIDAYLSGDKDARIDCDHEGELYKLFHSVNTLAGVLNAHAEKELQAREFLKDTISDISHQLKTPLTALNIYNGLLQEEAEEMPHIQEFASLSEKELDRIETLVQNLLKIAKLDAGSMVMELRPENVSEMMNDMAHHFSYRARAEQKELRLEGTEDVMLLCDRTWLLEAVDNVVKNALDHTGPGDVIQVEWTAYASVVRIRVRDNGSGIHPEDLHHIFKRFYRSRFSQDTQGIGLGLPLAKAIVEAHNGTMEADSQPGMGAAFTMNFLIPTKL